MKSIFSRIYTAFINMSLIYKLTLAYVITIVIPTVAIAFMTYARTEGFINDQALKTAQSLSSPVAAKITARLQNTSDIADHLAFNPRIVDFLHKKVEYSPDFLYEYSNFIQPLLKYIQTFNPKEAYQIRIFMRNQSIPEFWQFFYNEKRIEQADWYKEFINSPKVYSKWLDAHSGELFKLHSPEQITVYTLIKKIHSNSARYLGSIAVDISQKDLFDAVDEFKYPDSAIYILNKQNHLVYPGNTTLTPGTIQYVTSHFEKTGEKHYKDREAIYTLNQIDLLDLKVIGHYKTQRLIKNSTTASQNMIIVVFLGIILLEFITYLILNSIFKRIGKGVRIMKEVVKGDFSIRIPVDSRDEVGQLFEDFNILIQRINLLLQDLLKKETAQKDAQILALQYQINPHFIYNTIDNIRMDLECEGNYKSAEALTDFGKMLRYNLSSKSMFATVDEEIKHVLNYVNLQKYKYADRIHFDCVVPDEVKKLSIIKFILQPVVENSFKHGFSIDTTQLRIEVAMKLEDHLLLITVEDNGVGINPRRLYTLNYQLRNSAYEIREASKSGNGIALSNINERMKMFYGSQYCLVIESEPGKYTRTILRIPVSALDA